MSVLTMLLLPTADSDGTRVLLLILLLVAVVLIISGGVIAVLTLFKQRKDGTPEEP